MISFLSGVCFGGPWSGRMLVHHSHRYPVFIAVEAEKRIVEEEYVYDDRSRRWWWKGVPDINDPEDSTNDRAKSYAGRKR